MESTFIERQDKVLNAIYLMAGKQPDVLIQIDDLAQAVEMSFQEINPILIDLEERTRLIGAIETAVWMVPRGIEYLETPTSPMSHRDKEFNVLTKLKENNELTRRQLSELVGMADDDLFPMLVDFHNKNWVAMTWGAEGSVELLPSGRTALNKWDQVNTGSGDNFVIHNYGNNNQFGGRGNSLNVQQVSNPEFDEAISAIVALIKSSNLSAVAKEEALSNIEAVTTMAAQPSESFWERAKIKLASLETIVKGTEIAVKIAEHLPAIHQFVESWRHHT